MARIAYQTVRSDRRTIAIQVKRDGTVLVRCPRKMPASQVAAFVESKRHWICKQLSILPASAELLKARELKALKQAATEKIDAAVKQFAPRIGVTYGRISLRWQKTRWGSCSAKGNLNFNGLLALAPVEVLDYVVVHELCHRKEMNHSAKFWAEVEQVLPDYKAARLWLKKNGAELIARLP